MRVLREKYNACGIALSGYGMEEDVRRSIEAGFTSHITVRRHRLHLSFTSFSRWDRSLCT
jgi:hypothetical protein